MSMIYQPKQFALEKQLPKIFVSPPAPQLRSCYRYRTHRSNTFGFFIGYFNNTGNTCINEKVSRALLNEQFHLPMKVRIVSFTFSHRPLIYLIETEHIYSVSYLDSWVIIECHFFRADFYIFHKYQLNSGRHRSKRFILKESPSTNND